MEQKRFSKQMQAFDQWKNELVKGITRYRGWLDAHGMGSAEDELRIYEILESLKSDNLTIAFVAEFARGKTELINAIFFSDYDRRLLPSEAGRTTMCPTELFWDAKQGEAYIRLLPIETRLKETSISEYKLDPVHWTHIDLNLESPDAMAEAFKEVIRVKKVSAKEAAKLGLFSEEINGNDAEVEVPMWRHALISFPHPLLKRGLVILDTPGLNALGSEPELTVKMLPSAQAVMFVLAADTGVTKSDLDMWKHYVMALRNAEDTGVLVVLNKADTLWDELKSADVVAQSVRDQCRKVSETLGVDTNRVFPVSAQKGLLAKIRHDEKLLRKSNVLALEQVLATRILPYKQQLVRRHVVGEIGNMVKESHDLLASRLNSAKRQLNELRGLSGKNNEVIEHLMKKTRDEQVAYHKNVESFQANKRILSEQSKELMRLLSLGELDKLVAETRDAMSGSWTTHGLKAGMKTFFNGVRSRLDEVSTYADQLNRLVVTVYRKFHQEHGISEVKPVLFSPAKHLKELEQLEEEAEVFRNSPITTMTEQSFVIKKFFITLVSHARNIFFKAHRDAEQWSKAVMTPLVRQIKEHKEQMEQRLENLRKINDSRDTLDTRIKELEKTASALEKQFAEVRSILATINKPLAAPQTPSKKSKPSVAKTG